MTILQHLTKASSKNWLPSVHHQKAGEATFCHIFLVRQLLQGTIMIRKPAHNEKTLMKVTNAD